MGKHPNYGTDRAALVYPTPRMRTSAYDIDHIRLRTLVFDLDGDIDKAGAAFLSELSSFLVHA